MSAPAASFSPPSVFINTTIHTTAASQPACPGYVRPSIKLKPCAAGQGWVGMGWAPNAAPASSARASRLCTCMVTPTLSLLHRPCPALPDPILPYPTLPYPPHPFNLNQHMAAAGARRMEVVFMNTEGGSVGAAQRGRRGRTSGRRRGGVQRRAVEWLPRPPPPLLSLYAARRPRAQPAGRLPAASSGPSQVGARVQGAAQVVSRGHAT